MQERLPVLRGAGERGRPHAAVQDPPDRPSHLLSFKVVGKLFARHRRQHRTSRGLLQGRSTRPGPADVVGSDGAGDFSQQVDLAPVCQPRHHHVGFQDLGAFVGGDASLVQGVVQEEAELLVVHDADAAQDALEVRRSPLPVPALQVLALEGADRLHEFPHHLLGTHLGLGQRPELVGQGPDRLLSMRLGLGQRPQLLLGLPVRVGELAELPLHGPLGPYEAADQARELEELLAQQAGPEGVLPLGLSLQEAKQALEVFHGEGRLRSILAYR